MAGIILPVVDRRVPCFLLEYFQKELQLPVAKKFTNVIIIRMVYTWMFTVEMLT